MLNFKVIVFFVLIAVFFSGGLSFAQPQKVSIEFEKFLTKSIKALNHPEEKKLLKKTKEIRYIKNSAEESFFDEKANNYPLRIYTYFSACQGCYIEGYFVSVSRIEKNGGFGKPKLISVNWVKKGPDDALILTKLDFKEKEIIFEKRTGDFSFFMKKYNDLFKKRDQMRRLSPKARF